jgi:uncharacterized membrane protein
MTPQRLGYIAWTLLVLLQPAWYLWLAPPVTGEPLFALLLTLPPLLLPLFSLARPRRALLWIGIVALFYFCHGIVAAWVVPSARVPALLEALLCVALVGAVGWDTRQRKALAAR